MHEDFVIGREADFAEGDHQIVEVGGRSIGVYRTHGQLHAVQNLCPHALAPICMNGLSGTMLPSSPREYVFGMEGMVLRCPWHGWEFDIRTGEALFHTDRRKLATFPVRVEDGNVIVTLRPRKVQKPVNR